MEEFGALWDLAQKLIGAGGWLANASVAIIGGFALLMKMRGIGREDQAGAQQLKIGEQQSSFQERLLKALERADGREELLVTRIDQLSADNATLHQELTENRYELELVRNQLRNVTALLRQVRDGTLPPAALPAIEATPEPGG